MKRNSFLSLGVALILVFTLVFETQLVNPVLAQSTSTVDGEVAFDGWIVKNNGGYYSEDNGTIRVWSESHDQGVKFLQGN
jgi:hypothetical protein